QKWLCGNVEDRAYGYAVSQMIPEHFAEVKKRRFVALDKIAKAVRDRMTAEIQYWDFRAADLKQKEAAGKGNPRLNSGNAERRAEELEARMQKRLAELEAERNISAMPPVIVGGSLVIPMGLMCKLTGKPLPATFGQNDRQTVESAAMKAVMDIETRLGFIPKDVSAERCGYDIESEIPEDRRTGEGCLRCIEVKGRVKGADTVTITRKQQDSKDEDDSEISTGWETMLTAILKAGFSITGTWPIRTERAVRTIALGQNALATSIVLVCRKRPENAPMTTRRNLVNELRRELRPALRELQKSNIAPVDLTQSAIGPGMAVFSKYRQVLEADGTPMTIRAALQIINKELDLYFNEQDTDMDRESRVCVELYTQYALNEMKFGEADTLARAKNTSVAALDTMGVVYAQKGIVRLLNREEIAPEGGGPCLWLLTQQLARAMETGGIMGCAKIAARQPDRGARARDLAYRLFTIAERKGWTAEAYAYNNLVISWQEIQKAAMQIASEQTERQMEMGL
ncbi:MAG: DUF3883 domain-containing protein, partial [Oscillibacter sp.]|nr:DUF3883 domain-containing protein [Oscillibacter sp.]